MFDNLFTSAADACALAHAIVNTVREPLVVLDRDLRVIVASRSFYTVFKVTSEVTEGRLFFELEDGAWDYRNCATGFPTACRSSPASSCSRQRA